MRRSKLFLHVLVAGCGIHCSWPSDAPGDYDSTVGKPEPVDPAQDALLSETVIGTNGGTTWDGSC